ncbi:MAG: transglutaminase family protein [Bacteroidia bacterium]|nr:transglutaminase-like domain-containing protein [Bacteroidia bacterium]MDW8159278.1 transglutaminase family protein [Bacteroidia bacterium]
MDAKRFEALLQLLDDSDEAVVEAVDKELYNLGLGGIELLESAWERLGSRVAQERIEDIIQRIQFDHFSKELQEWSQLPSPSLIEGWLLLTRFQYPTLNYTVYKNEMNRLYNKIWLQFSPQMTLDWKLREINRQLFTFDNYKGNYDELDSPDLLFFNRVIDNKKGNSLSLCLLYLSICQELEIDLKLVNFMGFYALRYYTEYNHFYIDVFNRGLFLTPDQVKSFLNRNNIHVDLLEFETLNNVMAISRVAYSLYELYAHAQKFSKASTFERIALLLEFWAGGE